MRIRRSAPGSGLSVGIDLGTTFSAVARVDASGRPVILPNRDGENITPSVVLFDGEQPIVGTMAKRSVASAPLDVVQLVKRSMGDRSWRFETSGGTAYRPEEISALILKRLKADAEAALGSAVTDAVITVPAYFDDAPRRATIDAGTIAGFNVRRVVNEPTAAALAYGLRGDVDGTVLVYDLGGGTFDVTVMWMGGGKFEVLATFGDRNLGGFDFDNLLMRLLDERFVAAGGPSLIGDDNGEIQLRQQAELAKHALTTLDQTRVTLAADGFSTTVPVTRAEFETATSALLSRTRDIASMVVHEAGMIWPHIDHVLLAGGSTRMPMVRTMLEQLSGRAPDASANPDEVVAHGAAIQAQLLDGDGARDGASEAGIRTGGAPPRLRVYDVTSQGLGKIYVRGSRERPFNQVIIPRNTAIPAKGSWTAPTLRPRQSSIGSQITQGDDENVAFVRVIGEQGFPIPVYDYKAPFRTTLAYDENQTVYVEIEDVTTGELVGTFEIDNVANLTDDQVREAATRVRRIDVT